LVHSGLDWSGRLDLAVPGCLKAGMAKFAILLGGPLEVTARLRAQVAGARGIAADSGMAHAAALGLPVELWVGDFDSTPEELAQRYAHVPRERYPVAKDATDGEIAVRAALALGGTEFVLAGGLGGQADHILGHAGLVLRLAKQGTDAFLTTGCEEAYPILPGRRRLDLPPETRLSLIPYADFGGLDIEGVRWPLSKRDVPLGSSLTLSNVALGPVEIGLEEGYGLAIAYPSQ
jgi:thiamine pyrophosphokinase